MAERRWERSFKVTPGSTVEVGLPGAAITVVTGPAGVVVVAIRVEARSAGGDAAAEERLSAIQINATQQGGTVNVVAERQAGFGRRDWSGNTRISATVTAPPDVTLNLAREQLRRHGRRKEVEWPEGRDEPPAVEPLSRVDTADLERAIAGLPTGYRTVLVLHDVEGYRHEEIADLLGVSVGTSKSQLFHARRAVRTQLGASMGKGLTDA